MNNKNIIIAGVIAIGVYLFSQGKAIFSAHPTQTMKRKVAPKRIGQPTTQAAYIAARIAAARKAALRKAAARQIGKKIGKTVAQKIKARRAAMARHAKKQRPQIQRPRPTKKQITSRLFSGAEKSRIIPYLESSRHSYYGPKSRKVLNPGYMEKRYKADQKQALEFRLNELRDMFPGSNI